MVKVDHLLMGYLSVSVVKLIGGGSSTNAAIPSSSIKSELFLKRYTTPYRMRVGKSEKETNWVSRCFKKD